LFYLESFASTRLTGKQTALVAGATMTPEKQYLIEKDYQHRPAKGPFKYLI
jgi:hypothetical protein